MEKANKGEGVDAPTTPGEPAYEFKLSRVREAGPSRRVDSPELAYGYWQDVITGAGWFHENKEHLVVLLLDARQNIGGFNLVSMGSIDETVAGPREIFAPVLCGGAHSFIMMHNHPSGDPSPSAADRELTRRIREAGELLKVSMLDHVIAGRADVGPDLEPYFSFREMGLI